MALETGTFISDLNASNPTAGDPISAGDDHIRLLKSTIKATFPNLTGAMTATQVELNYLSGLSANVQTQLNAKAALAHTHAEEDITDGGIFPRLAATEVIAGSWNFTTRPQVNGNGVLDSASAIPETQIADGAVFPRIAANETITGNWAFSGTINAGGVNVAGNGVWHAGNLNPANYSLASHLHTGVYANASHTHDDRYYTEAEVNALLGTSGQFSMTLRTSAGGTVLATATAYWSKINGIVTLRIPSSLTTSNSTVVLYLQGLPAEIRATAAQAILIRAYDNSQFVTGVLVTFANQDYMQLQTLTNGAWAATGLKGPDASVITYLIA